MNFTTPVNIPIKKSIDHNSVILMLGSCFAENIGNLLADNHFNICLNPTGILYNPISIANVLKRLVDNLDFTQDDLFYYNGLWSSFYHHGSFSDSDKDITLSKINNQFQIGCSQLKKATHLIITFGSSSVYENNGIVVSNCHKLPACKFNERFLTIDEIVTTYNNVINSIRRINPDIQIIFTISPVRYLGHGAQIGQINKSILILAVSDICKKNDNIQYFPSYEIMMDELRDYRFYAPDMIHPSPIAVEYIYNRFKDTYFTKDAINTSEEIDKINKSLSHRPLHPDSDTYIQFKKKLSQQIAAIADKYPNIKFNI